MGTWNLDNLHRSQATADDVDVRARPPAVALAAVFGPALATLPAVAAILIGATPLAAEVPADVGFR
jgi:hypothetical protein